MATKFPIETDKPVIEVTLPVGRHVLELVVEDSAGLRSAPDTIVITVQKAEPVAVAISPTAASLASGKQQQFSATVNGASNKAVTWSVQESGGGTITTAGLYTAPAADGTYHVRATSVADPSKSASATVTVSTVTCVAGSPGVPCTGAAPMSCVAGAPGTPCTSAAPIITCVAGAPSIPCSGGTPTILCTTGSPSVVACSGATPTVSCVSGSPSTPCSGSSPTILCTTGTPSVVACSSATPTVVTCTLGGPGAVRECVSASPQVLSCTGATPSIIIRSEADTEANKAEPAEKPSVQPKTKPKPKK